MRRPLGGRRLALLTVGLTTLAAAPTAGAQEYGVDAIVVQIAGANLYLDVGVEQGVAANDTLRVYRSADGEYLGTFRVVTSLQNRSVVEFVGEPFPVTRGSVLYLFLGPDPAGARGRPAERRDPARERASRRRGLSPQLHGRLSIEGNAFESKTLWQSNQPEEVTRRFATSSIGLRAVMSHLPGGITVSTNLRGSYRYSSSGIVQPERQVRAYQASVARSSSALHIEVGRFNSRYETYSGYWDGILVHVGGEGLGVGVAAGFEPEQANEEFTSTLPKYSAFVTYRHRAGAVRFDTDVSAHQVRPRNGLFDHTFLGWSQRLRIRRFQLSHDVQVDRHPQTDKWVVTRLHVRTSLPLVGGLSVHGRLAVRQPYSLWSTQDVIALRRDQATVGLSYWGPGGSLNLDVTANRFDLQRDLSYTYASSFNITRTPVLGFGLSGAASYWRQDATRSLYLTSGVNRAFGRLQTRASYQLYRTESTTDNVLTGSATNRFQTHAVHFSLSLPLARRVYSTAQARSQWGENLVTTSLYMSLWTSF